MAVQQQPFSAANGGVANSTAVWIAMSYGFALLVNAWAFYRISGGLFNPAVCFPILVACYTVLIVYVAGYTRLVRRWPTPLAPSRVPLPRATPRLISCGWTCRCYVSWVGLSAEHDPRTRYFDCPRRISRDVLYGPAGIRSVDVGRGEVAGHVPRTHRHWAHCICGLDPWYVEPHLCIISYCLGLADT